MSLTLTDIFAGAGGSSTGAAMVPGVEVTLSANHWPLAVQVHQMNHPTTEHALVDLHLEDPRNFPRTDILWASPECTKWSVANSKATALSLEMGGDPTLFDDVPDDLISRDQDEIDRSRLLMFDVLRFIEHHRYRFVVVENVVDIATQPKFARAWELWRKGLQKLGYQYRVVSLNSMHAQMAGDPAPQSRDRLYIVAWPNGETAPDIDRALSPRAWCPRCDTTVHARQAWKNGRTVGRYRAQYIYVCPACGTAVEPAWLPASTAIDWTIQGQLIGDRTKPLSDKTMARIREGLRRYGHEFLTQFRDRTRDLDPHQTPLNTIVADGANYGLVTPDPFILDRRGEYRIREITDPLTTITANETTKALLIPVEGRAGKEARPDTLPLRTQTCRSELGILTTLRGTNTPKHTSEPLDTVAASGNHHGLLVPSGGTWHETAHPTSDPMRTVTTRENHGLLVPYYSGSESAKPTTQPIGTLTTRDRYALVMRNNTPRGNPAQMVTPASEPLRSLLATGPTPSLLEPTTIDPNDCTFRMLEPHEIAAGMSFPHDYKWAGTKRERVRLAGNAVTPPAARDLIWIIAQQLGAAA